MRESEMRIGSKIEFRVGRETVRGTVEDFDEKSGRPILYTEEGRWCYLAQVTRVINY